MQKQGNRVFLGLGTNLGNKSANLSEAIRLIEMEAGNLLVASAVYETAPWGIKDQPRFLNQVILIESPLAPVPLLEQLLAIEQQMGRQRIQKWGSRLIDIDILFYNDVIFQSASLTLPHPFIQDRNFVLAPLAEIAADHIHPVFQLTAHELLEQSPDLLPVMPLSPVN
jgi:2-amino-4-hydroxy-6-hydroxymethyldihydropteridine diphosphokinase